MKELDDEEAIFSAHQEPLYRVETGNYEYRFEENFSFSIFKKIFYRLVLRCRQLARERFARTRSDVMVKLELLDQKHGLFLSILDKHSFISIVVQDIVFQLHRFISALDKYHRDCNEIMKEADIFPIEAELDIPISRQKEFHDDEDEQNEQITTNDNQQKETDDIDILDLNE